MKKLKKFLNILCWVFVALFGVYDPEGFKETYRSIK
jgi:hypothetical protein